jgi:glycosyltransferase involved in cell wall biosynthesis
MHIVFIDPAGMQYTVETPYERPLGGSQSAVCYLAIELARLGHSVTVLNGNATTSEGRGVKIDNISALYSPSFRAGFDIGVVLNAASAHRLRQVLNMSTPLVLWTQHSHDQPGIQELRELHERKAWSAFAFVSDWQRQNFEKLFWVPAEKSRVMRNAVSPAFAECSTLTPWFATDEAPVLFYSSTPFRGLDVLLNAFPKIRAAIPDVRLRVYSSMAVYQMPPDEDKFYHPLYDLARGMEGVEYVGSVGQKRLANELTGSAALAYPSTFAETSCIAAIEAMAAGAAVFTSNLGALPETTQGHAAMVDWQPDNARLTDDFAAMCIQTLREVLEDPRSAMSRREQRLEFIRKNYLWPDRAKQWAEWLTQVVNEAQPAQI